MNEPARHCWLDEWVGAASPRLRRLVDETTNLIEQHERETGERQRKRRPVDQERHLTAVEVVVSNLAHAVVSPPPTGRLAVLTGNGTRGFTRYDNRALGKPLTDLLDTLAGIGWLDRICGGRDERGRGVATSISPTAAFGAKVREAGIALSDFGRVAGEEVIIAKRKLTDRYGGVIDRAWVDYPESTTTMALRETMRDLNGFLAKADISFIDDGLGPVDLSNRAQKRHFVCGADEKVPSFNLGGRLYGGAWQNLPKARRAGLRIEGEPIAVLDYASMAPRLAYASLGEVPPEGDIYALPGLETESVRPAVKRAFDTFLCDPFRRTRGWPPVQEGDPELPADWTVARFRRALLSRHPMLLPCLSTGMAPRLQHTESSILIEVLGELKARGIQSLSLHDGLFCPASKASEVEKVMVVTASDIAKASIPVTIKGPAAAL